MITEKFFDIVKLIILSVLEIMPPLDFLSISYGSIASIVELVANTSYFVPYTSIFICLGIWVSFHVFRLGVSITNWLISKIPTIS